MPGIQTIRSVVPADRARWEPLWEGYNRFYQRTLPADITGTTWSRFLDPAESAWPTICFIAARS